MILFCEKKENALTCLLTFAIQGENGKQPSRPYAKATREAATLQPAPIKKAQITVRATSAVAVFGGSTDER